MTRKIGFTATSVLLVSIILIIMIGSHPPLREIERNHEQKQRFHGFKLLKLDSILEQRYEEDRGWYPFTLIAFEYIDDTLLKSKVISKDYLSSSKQYSDLSEYHYINKPFSPSSFLENLKDNQVNSNQKVVHFVFEKIKDRQREYQFRYDSHRKSWYQFRMVIDKLDQNSLIKERYIINNPDLNKITSHESKETYEYSDSLLIRKVSYSKKDILNSEWQRVRKELNIYDDNHLKEHTVLFYQDPKGWKTVEKEVYQYDNEGFTKTYFESQDEEGLLPQYRRIEKIDGNGNLILRKHLNWNHIEKNFSEVYNTKYIYKGTKEVERITTYYDHGLYQRSIKNLYDIKGRKVKENLRAKEQEDQEWQVLEKTEFGYKNDDNKYSSIKKWNRLGMIIQEASLEFDSVNNPIQRRFRIDENTVFERTFSHLKSITTSDVIIPDRSEILQEVIGDEKWTHRNPILSETVIRLKNGHGKPYRKIRYYYSKVE